MTLNIENIDIEFERKQFACILQMIEFINLYREFCNNCYAVRRFQYLKPERNAKMLTNKDLKKIYLIKLMKFLFHKVVQLVKEKRTK